MKSLIKIIGVKCKKIITSYKLPVRNASMGEVPKNWNWVEFKSTCHSLLIVRINFDNSFFFLKKSLICIDTFQPVHRAYYVVGSSSLEESLGTDECCTFRGSFSKLDVESGAISWQTFMLPPNNGTRGEYAGAAVWGSSPSIDTSRNHIYIATGNLYSAPLHIRQCQEKENNQTRPTHPDECVEPDNHSDSILALDLDSGYVTWYHQLGGYDVWFAACNNLSTPNCPRGPNPDADFGEAPMVLTITDANGTKQDVVVAVQKSGFAWALHRDNGYLVWSTVTNLWTYISLFLAR